jgi:hypothetical protein
MALVFPENRESYKAFIRFTLVDDQQKEISFDEDASAIGSDTASASESQIELYLPQGIQVSDKVEYENAGLGFGAALAGDTSANAEGVAPSESLASKDVMKTLLGQIVSKGTDRGGQVLSARNKVAPNPNTRALFKQVNLRSFAFSFKFIPVNQKEAETIKKIINFFRTELYPDDIVVGDLSIGYRFPNRFMVGMFYGDEQMPLAPKIAPAYIDSFTTNYNPTNQTFIIGEDGKPYFSEIDINFTLTESKALNRKSISEEGF